MVSTDTRVTKQLPTVVRIGLAIALIGSFALAVYTGQPLLWLFGVLTVGGTLSLLWLFYRLVVAVETIARKL
ncbi:hypothetical protein JMJ58_12150 [Haloterrigena salifodinae]|uniref:Uncharacterized protein n=1 Tax=Haloterrigena salifodinae TaxID=2675099 RepID=A0A8T8DX62_9EURY|nr:hypothetical protein [Haloterrigena salifodinae]QRV13706.1 hypothetical protein JMJ58_12150 [Haloterrigena salifodinae]